MSAYCEHKNFSARVNVSRLSEAEGGAITGYTAEVTIHCAECGHPFQFIGIPAGISFLSPRVSADAMEARLPIAPMPTAAQLRTPGRDRAATVLATVKASLTPNLLPPPSQNAISGLNHQAQKGDTPALAARQSRCGSHPVSCR